MPYALGATNGSHGRRADCGTGPSMLNGQLLRLLLQQQVLRANLLVGRDELRELLLQLPVAQHGVGVVRRVVDDAAKQLRGDGRGERDEEHGAEHETTNHGRPPGRGNAGAIGRAAPGHCDRYTLMRCPSRIVTVGRRFRNRSSTRALDCETLAADALAIGVERRGVEADAALPLREAGDGPEGERHAEDLRVVPIHLIAQAEIADLVEAVERGRG